MSKTVAGKEVSYVGKYYQHRWDPLRFLKVETQLTAKYKKPRPSQIELCCIEVDLGTSLTKWNCKIDVKQLRHSYRRVPTLLGAIKVGE